MTYQGERVRQPADETGRCFLVRKIRIAADGHVSDVLWGEVDPASDRDVGDPVVAPADDVVDAIHDGARVAASFGASTRKTKLPLRLFAVFQRRGGGECIAFDAPISMGRELHDMVRLDDAPAATPTRSRAPARGRATAPPAPARRAPHATKVYAVSKVELDADGRVTRVLWGRVDTAKNDWAAPERIAPVIDAVRVLQAGDPVFALFPTTNGHVPDRRFVVAAYDDGRQTLVLDGPATHEREIHDMDRITSPARAARSTAR
jgi:hypothetical protein